MTITIHDPDVERPEELRASREQQDRLIDEFVAALHGSQAPHPTASPTP